jgi:hypothetical protein
VRGARYIAIDLRDVVSGDAKAALERVQAGPGIELAYLSRGELDRLDLCDP